VTEFNYIQNSREEALAGAKRLVADSVWKQANIEIRDGITFPETAEILGGSVPTGVPLEDAIVVRNIKRAWDYCLSHIDEPVNLDLIENYNNTLGDNGLTPGIGKLRKMTVLVSGSSYQPPIPEREEVVKELEEIGKLANPIEKALTYFTRISREQWFRDGNKRTATLVANHSLIQDGVALFNPDVKSRDSQRIFFEKLIAFYEHPEQEPDFQQYLYETGVQELKSGLLMVDALKDDSVR